MKKSNQWLLAGLVVLLALPIIMISWYHSQRLTTIDKAGIPRYKVYPMTINRDMKKQDLDSLQRLVQADGGQLTFDTVKFMEDGSLHRLSGTVDYPSTSASFHTDSLNKVLIHKRPLMIGVQVK